MAIATCWRDLLQDWTRLLSCLRAWQPWMPGGGTAFSPREKRHRTPTRQSFIQWSSHVPGLSGRLLPQVWLLARAVLADPGYSLVWPYTSTTTLPSSAPIHFAHRYQGAADNVASSMAVLELWLLSSTYTCLRIPRSIGRNLEKSHFLFNRLFSSTVANESERHQHKMYVSSYKPEVPRGTDCCTYHS